MDSDTLREAMEVDLASAASDAGDSLMNQDLTQMFAFNYDREHTVSRWVESVDSSAPIDDAVYHNEGLMDEAVAFSLGSSSAVYNEEGDCPICKEPFEQQSITVLVCGHRFCSQCKDEWFKERENCPICRAGPDGTPQLPDDEDDTYGRGNDDADDGNTSDDGDYGYDPFGDCRSCGNPDYNAPRWSYMRENLRNRYEPTARPPAGDDDQSSQLDYEVEPIALPWYDTQSE